MWKVPFFFPFNSCVRLCILSVWSIRGGMREPCLDRWVYLLLGLNSTSFSYFFLSYPCVAYTFFLKKVLSFFLTCYINKSSTQVEKLINLIEFLRVKGSFQIYSLRPKKKLSYWMLTYSSTTNLYLSMSMSTSSMRFSFLGRRE